MTWLISAPTLRYKMYTRNANFEESREFCKSKCETLARVYKQEDLNAITALV